MNIKRDSKLFHFLLYIILQAVQNRQHCYDTEYPDRDTKQRKKSAQFICPKLLEGLYDTRTYYLRNIIHRFSKFSGYTRQGANERSFLEKDK